MEVPFKVRDKRNKGWFYLDNEYLNGYAKIFGAIGTAIYVSLCRHVDNDSQQCFPSMELIGEELNISRDTVSKYINLFEKHKLIYVKRLRDNKTMKWKNNTYWLLDKSEWNTHAEITHIDSHAEMTGEPCGNDRESHAELFGNNNTHNINTNNKDTKNLSPVLINKTSTIENINVSNSKRFIKPSLEEVKEYILAQGYKVDAEHWLDYYESNGWKVGRNPMKDWKAAVRTWSKKDNKFNNNNSKNVYVV